MAEPQEEVLLEFRAGRMTMEGTRVNADPRKGLFRIVRKDELLVCVQWVDRASLFVEEELIVFPNESKFEKVQQSAGRVFLLSFPADDRKLFFWMQEPKADQDEFYCQLVNKLLNEAAEEEDEDGDPLQAESDDADGEGGDSAMETDTPSGGPQQQQPGGAQREGDSTQPPPESGDSAGGHSHQQSGSAPSAAASVAAALGPAPPLSQDQVDAALRQVQLAAALQSAMSGLSQGLPPHLQGASAQGKAAKLTDVLKPEVMLPLLEDPAVQDRLAQFLPADLRSPQELRDVINSPQLQQQLDGLSQLLIQGRIDLSQFGIDANKYGMGVLAFLEAIDDIAHQDKNNGSKIEDENQN